VVPGRRADLRGAGAHLSDPSGVYVIFNPASGRGRGGRRLERYRALLGRHLPGYAHGVTRAAGDEYALAERALADGYHTVVAVGGDGTWSHVADRIVASSRRDVRFAPLPAGTGNDFGRGLGLDYRDPAAAVRTLAAGRTVRIDVGRVRTASAPAVPGRPGPAAGEVRERHFLNLVGFGFDVAVVDAAAAARFLEGELLYKVTALQQLVRFPGLELAVSDRAGFERGGRHLMVTVSNGRYFGGGFPIAPGADVRDGLLHACIIGDARALTRMRLFGLAGSGRHVESERVTMHSAPRFRLTAAPPLRFEVDGDLFEAAGGEVDVEILPGALEVVAP
jgi:YegS/Rv2252/BmrU family lipid kinase